MGRGDKRTAKGKRTRGTYGKSRPRKSNLVKKPAKAKVAAKAAS